MDSASNGVDPVDPEAWCVSWWGSLLLELCGDLCMTPCSRSIRNGSRVGRLGLLTLVAAPLLASGLVGCGSSQLSKVRRDPTPGLDAFARSHDRVQNDVALTYDHNKRMIVDDWNSFWLLDRPSKLTEHPLSR